MTQRINRPHTILVDACQQLWHRAAYEVYWQFTYVDLVSQPSSSTPLLLGVSEQMLHSVCPPESSEGYVVGKASNLTVAGDARFPRLLLVVQQVHYRTG